MDFMGAGKGSNIIENFIKYDINVNWLKEISSHKYNKELSMAFAKENQIDYFNLRLLQFIKQTLGIESLKMPIFQLIDLLKYEKMLEIERAELNLQIEKL